MAYLCFLSNSPFPFLLNTNGSRFETTMRGALISLLLLPMLVKSVTNTIFKLNLDKTILVRGR